MSADIMRGKVKPNQFRIRNSDTPYTSRPPIISISNLQAPVNTIPQGTKTLQVPQHSMASSSGAMPNNSRTSADIRPPCHLLQLRPRYSPTELPIMYIASSRGGFGEISMDPHQIHR